MLRAAGLLIFLLALCIPSRAQDCPRENPSGPAFDSGVVTLTGKAILHTDLRRWMELRLDRPVCGTNSIQLLNGVGGAFEVDEGGSQSFETLRGCRVVVQGTLGIPGTGYYSADLYVNVESIKPDPKCKLQPALPDYSKARPARWVRSYRVLMALDYAVRGGPIAFTVTSRGRRLGPWQAYASYWLTGGYVLYGSCAKGFLVRKVFGTPEANPFHFDEPGTPEDQATFDPESAATKHITKLTLGYTCQR